MRFVSLLAIAFAVITGVTIPAEAHAVPTASSAHCAAPRAADTSSIQGWIGYLASHPDDYALRVTPIDGAPISHDSGAVFPAASSVKLIHLAAYARAVADRHLDPEARVSVTEWQRWYLALDGGAHARALAYLKIPAVDGIPVDGTRTVTYEQLADVMIRFSDSAAPDLLRKMLGDNSLRSVMDRFGFPGDAPSLLGAYLATIDPTLQRPDDAFRAAQRYHDDPAYAAAIRARVATGDPDAARANALLQATPNALHSLMTALADGSFGPGAPLARRVLEYQGPSSDGSILGFKGGSLPGVITEVFEYRTADGRIGVGTLMVRGLSDADTKADNFAHQKLLLAAITDPAVAHALRCIA
ncbi:serine hydrolase [Gordonia aichiensis]